MSRRRWLIARGGATDIALAVLLILVLAVGEAQADEPHRAGLVVRFDDGQVYTACLAFSEDSLTGLQVLERSGLTVHRGFGGGAVCRIEDLGCEGDNCFCQCTGTDCRYWAYFRLGPDGTWKYSQVGAVDAVVRDGDVEGWSWGPGAKAPPPVISFEDVCPPATATPLPAQEGTNSVPPPTINRSQPPTPQPATPVPASVDASPAEVPASYGAFALVVLSLIGFLVALRPGRTSRR